MKLQRGRATLVQLEQFFSGKEHRAARQKRAAILLVVFMVIAPVW
jgi:hypothetical protein